jgi:hypothetical protein
MAMMDTEATGSEMANHCAQERGVSIIPRAIRFCGEEIGEAWPPMLDARAIARMRHRENIDLGDSSSVIGWDVVDDQ